MKEEELIKEIAKGKEDALRTFIKLYERRVFMYAYSVLQNYEDAEEATSETFFQVWRSAKNFEGRSKVSSWVFGIARHVCMGMLRKKLKHPPTLELFETDAVVEEEDAQLDIELLRKALELLPPHHREVLHLAYYEELPYEEIAQILRIPLNTVKTRVHYAKKKLLEVVRELSGERKL